MGGPLSSVEYTIGPPISPNTASVKRVTELAQQVLEKPKVFTDYLSARELEGASFDVEGFAAFPMPPEDEVAYNTSNGLVKATKELHNIAQRPKQASRSLAWDDGSNSTKLNICAATQMYSGLKNLSLQAMWGFKVAESVPLADFISYDNLTFQAELFNNSLLFVGSSGRGYGSRCDSAAGGPRQDTKSLAECKWQAGLPWQVKQGEDIGKRPGRIQAISAIPQGPILGLDDP